MEAGLFLSGTTSLLPWGKRDYNPRANRAYFVISLNADVYDRMQKNFTSTGRALIALLLLSFSGLTCSDVLAVSAHAHVTDLLELFLKSNPENLPELAQAPVAAFYRERNYEPLWFDENVLLSRAYDLFHTISQSEDDGLSPADYYVDSIKKYWESKTSEDIAYLDLLLTAALYRYAHDVHSGRLNPYMVETDWHIPHASLNIVELLVNVAKQKSIISLLQALSPQHSGYRRLKQKLRFYREIARTGGWKTIEPGPVLEIGVQNLQVIQLRRRLEISTDLSSDAVADSDIFDSKLADAVKHYQARQGLEADGRVGPKTRQQLNVSLDDRIRQILVSMERWRWMPRRLDSRYLIVNMAGFELRLVQNEVDVLTMPVIIGKAYRSTPSFSGVISYMEYNPYWTIPRKIALADIIPREIQDPDFLTSRSIRVFRGWANAQEIDPKTVNWREIDAEHFPYWLRQDPGPQNALGSIKFIVSNPYEIYLHGTPDKHLFDSVIRTFSSGCIRVKDPVSLAAWLLKDGSLAAEEDVLANVHLGTSQRETLPVSMPIYIVYFTAWVDQDGNMNFRGDVYGRDRLLNKAFDQQARPLAG